MKIRFQCVPGYDEYLPRPVLSKTALPSWLRKMPSTVESSALGGASVRTLKQCQPFLDAMQWGVLFPLATDLYIADGELSWDWDIPASPHSRASRSPIGVHVPEQARGLPGANEQEFVVKFNNFWTIALPEGWSMVFTHPLNRTDLPFRTFSGMVNCDQWKDGFVHFPAVWTDSSFQGVLPAGTPVAQAWPVYRESPELVFSEMAEEDVIAHKHNQDELQRAPGYYRRQIGKES